MGLKLDTSHVNSKTSLYATVSYIPVSPTTGERRPNRVDEASILVLISIVFEQKLYYYETMSTNTNNHYP